MLKNAGTVLGFGSWSRDLRCEHTGSSVVVIMVGPVIMHECGMSVGTNQ